jgi:hypothetical protein
MKDGESMKKNRKKDIEKARIQSYLEIYIDEE